jgi:phosphohistidine phosphatase SixA
MEAMAGSQDSQEKVVVLVRHAQSLENVKINAARAGLERIKSAKAPLLDQWGKSFSLLRMNLDEEVSPLGKRQIESVAKKVRDMKFIETFAPELMVHSPLRRARETARGLFPGFSFVQFDALRESAPHELVFSSPVYARIREFESYLASRPEKRVVVVGHCRYFKMMTGSSTLMDNVSALRYTFDPSREEKWQLVEPVFKYDHEEDKDEGETKNEAAVAQEVTSCSEQQAPSEKTELSAPDATVTAEPSVAPS